MRWFVLIILFFGFLINFADKSVVGLAASSMMEDLGLSYVQWGIIGSSFFWVFPVAAIVVGVLTDKFNSKKMISFMLLAWSLLQIVGGFAIVGFSTLLFYRIFLGIAEGGYAPASLRLLYAYFSPNLRARVTTIFTAGSTVGAYGVAPLVVLLIQFSGWRQTFVMMGLVSIVILVVWMFLVPNKTPVLEELKQPKVETAPKKKATWADVYPVLLSKTSLFTLLATFGFFFLSAWMQIWMPVYFIQVVGVTEIQMANSILVIGFTSLAFSFLMATISDRAFKRTKNLRVSRVNVTGLGMIAGALFLGSLIFIQTHIWSIIAITLAYGLSIVILSNSHIILSSQLPERTSTLSGTIVAFQNVAAMISPIATGFIIQYAGDENITRGFSFTFLMVAGVILLTAVLFMLFVNPDKKLKQEQENLEGAV